MGRVAAGAVVIALTVLGVVAVSRPVHHHPQDTKDLVTYTGPDFSILMPGQPTARNSVLPLTSGGSLNMFEYVVGSSDGAVVLGTADLAGKTFDLDKAVPGMASRSGAQVEATRSFPFHGYPGVAAQLAVSSPFVGTVYAEIFVADHHLFEVIQVVQGHDAPVPISLHKILDSFQYRG